MSDEALRNRHDEYERVLNILDAHLTRGANELKRTIRGAMSAIDQELERRAASLADPLSADDSDRPVHRRQRDEQLTS